ncbi:MAG: hypothetical protein KDK01_17510 [Rhodobacteraceae bacterium]|jgi:hypothetical protein|nr:hypothetical protein [Paracoccaceae bacterium]
MTTLSPETITRLFTRADGQYLFARWGRPIVPIVFGTDDATLATVKGAIEAVVLLAGHRMAEHDPELGVNLMVFFFREWDELLAVPDLDRMVEGLAPTVARLKAAKANQYRAFRFDADGAIKAAFVFVRMDDAMSALPAADIALLQAAQVILLWSDTAFADRSPLARAGDTAVLHPDIAALIAAGYDRVLPALATDPSHALRLAARVR